MSEENEDSIIEQGDYSHFTPLALSAVHGIREKKKQPDTSSIYDYIMKTQASNAEKALIDSVIIKLTLEGKIINKKTPQGLDSFYNSTQEIGNIQYDHSHNQLQSTNSTNINSSFHSETAPSIGKNLQTPICESSVTNTVVSNIEIPSDNPTFKENTSHINTSQLKPDSNDTLHFSKTGELEAKFDALKSLVTREISNLANKLDSISLILNQTSKTLEKRGVNNSKLLQDNFEFLCQEILSKDKLVNYSMETQTKILNLATSARNQEKTQEKLQKINIPQQQQQYLQSQHIQQHFSRELNACQNQTHSEHDIFQAKVRPQSSKESNSQNTLKNLYVGNLNENISEEDLYDLFGLRNLNENISEEDLYLKENCCVKIVLSKSSLSSGFAFITAPYDVCIELIKLNGIDFKSHHLTTEEDLVKPKVKESSP